MAWRNGLLINRALDKERLEGFISIQNYTGIRRYLRWLGDLLPKLSAKKKILFIPQCHTNLWFGKPSRRHWNGSAWPRSTNNKHTRNSCFGFSIVSALATLTFYQLPDFNVRKEAVPLSKYTQLFANRWWAIWSALSNSSVQIR